ncbi:MAG: phosphoribosylanthranilate isomerase [Halieaceae bacterium]|nr:phosphoribosylanthranilate isomerase [Halieaceae bacterium]
MTVTVARTRIKICGITRPEDAQAAAAAGADAIGLVFYPTSPRAVTIEQAQAVLAATPALVTRVGLFVDADAGWVAEVARELSLDLLQLHGDESVEYCETLQYPWMKALRVRPDTDVAAEVARYAAGSAVLLDAYKQGVPGGTGESFDWTQAPAEATVPLVLAGGLEPGNVGAAIDTLRPYAVDVSGGVESAPGIKSPERIAAFARAVAQADGRLEEQGSEPRLVTSSN